MGKLSAQNVMGMLQMAIYAEGLVPGELEGAVNNVFYYSFIESAQLFSPCFPQAHRSMYKLP